MTERTEVGLIGLGLMGTAMSDRMLKAGYAVHGFDVRPSGTRRTPAARRHRCGLSGGGGPPLSTGPAVASQRVRR